MPRCEARSARSSIARRFRGASTRCGSFPSPTPTAHVETRAVHGPRCHRRPAQVEGEFGSRVADVGAVSEATRALARSLDPAAARKAFCTGACEVAQAPVAVLFEPAKSGTRRWWPRRRSVPKLGGFEVPIDGESGAALRVQSCGGGFRLARERDQRPTAKFMRRDRIRGGALAPGRRAIGPRSESSRSHGATKPPASRCGSRRCSTLLAAEAAVAIGRADLLGQLEHMARTDGLTGLPNRRYWEQQLPRELARAERDEHPLCVAMLDLDHFKAYNDRRGHQAGDRLLTEAAAAWRRGAASLRHPRPLRRRGVQRDPARRETSTTRSRWSSACGRRPRAASHAPPASPSGTATSSRTRSSAAPTRALYRAKRAGRDRVGHRPPDVDAGS